MKLSNALILLFTFIAVQWGSKDALTGDAGYNEEAQTERFRSVEVKGNHRRFECDEH